MGTRTAKSQKNAPPRRNGALQLPAGSKLDADKAVLGFGEAELARLFELRPDLAHPAPASLVELGARSTETRSVQACVDRLDELARKVLEALTLLDRPATLLGLLDLLGPEVPRGAVEGALARLAERALVARMGESLSALSVLHGSRAAGLGPPAAPLLERLRADQLSDLAKALGVAPSSSRKADLVAALLAGLGDPATVRAALVGAPDGTAELVEQMAAGRPDVPLGYGLADYPYSHSITKEAQDSPKGWLLRRGLLLSPSWGNAVMPREIGLAMRGGHVWPHLRPARPPVKPAPLDAARVDQLCSEQALRTVSDLASTIEEWGARPPRLLKAGGLGVRELRKVAVSTGRSEADAAFLVELASAAGLVVPRSGALSPSGSAEVLPCPSFDAWIELDTVHRWAHLVLSWLLVPWPLVLVGEKGADGKPVMPFFGWQRDACFPDRRRILLHSLAELASGKGATPGSLQSRLGWDAPGLWQAGGTSADLSVARELHHAEILGLTAMGALSGAGRAVERGAFEEAAAELASLAPETASELVVQADLTALAPGELPAAVRAELELMADVESKGVATVYRFSEHSVLRAFEAGRSDQEILGFLERHAPRGVPQALSYLVGDIGRRFGVLRAGAVSCYLRCDDAALLAEVLSARSTAGAGFRAIAPTVLVTHEDRATVVRTLRAAGYLAAPESADGSLVLVRPERHRASGDTARHRGWAPPPVGAMQAPDVSPGVFEPPGTSSREDHVQLAARLLSDEDFDEDFDKLLPDDDLWETGEEAAAAELAALLGADPELLAELLSALPECSRPTAIAKGGGDVLDMLEHAAAHEWFVRVAYMNVKGTTSEANVAVLDVEGDDVALCILPEVAPQVVALTRIEWARVLTEAEEEAL